MDSSSSSDSAPDLKFVDASGSIEGGYLTVNATITNGGGSGASGFWVDLFVNPGSTPSVGDYGEAYEYVNYLGSDSNAAVEFQVAVSGGSHDVYVVVDTNDDVDESNESNNMVEGTLTSSGDGGGSSGDNGPDLGVSYFAAYADDSYLYYYVDVTNYGDEDAGSFYVDLFVDESSQPSLYADGDDYTTISSLSAGATEYADFLIEQTCDSCQSWVLVDSFENVKESDESNNVDGPITVDSE